MDNVEIIKINREPNWLPPFRVEYDGKYVTLFGEDKDYQVPYYGKEPHEPQYEEMVLVPVAYEDRHIGATVKEYTDEHVIIEIIKTIVED